MRHRQEVLAGSAGESAASPARAEGSSQPVRAALREILAAEAEAQRLVAHAREQAAGLVLAARTEARQILAASQEQTRLDAEAATSAALAEARRERDERLEAARTEIHRSLTLDSASRQRAADLVLRCVLLLPGEEGGP